MFFYLKVLVKDLKNEIHRLTMKRRSPDISASMLSKKTKYVYSFPRPLNDDCYNIREMISHLKSSKMSASKFYDLATTQSQQLISFSRAALYSHISNQANTSINVRKSRVGDKRIRTGRPPIIADLPLDALIKT